MYVKSNNMKLAIIYMTLLFTTGMDTSAQDKPNPSLTYTRIAKLVIDSAQLESYKGILKEEMEASVRVEPGVLALRAVYDIKNPTFVTLLEIYADKDAYNLHIKSPHFLKYKNSTTAMVKSLELIDVTPISFAAKPGW
jgi:quinol monooxygenase YgiN